MEILIRLRVSKKILEKNFFTALKQNFTSIFWYNNAKGKIEYVERKRRKSRNM